MSVTHKQHSKQDFEQVIKGAGNDIDQTITVNGYLVGLVGRKVVASLSTTSTSNDTITYDFQERQNGVYVSLYQIAIVYPATQILSFISAERVS